MVRPVRHARRLVTAAVQPHSLHVFAGMHCLVLIPWPTGLAGVYLVLCQGSATHLRCGFSSLRGSVLQVCQCCTQHWQPSHMHAGFQVTGKCCVKRHSCTPVLSRSCSGLLTWSSKMPAAAAAPYSIIAPPEHQFPNKPVHKALPRYTMLAMPIPNRIAAGPAELRNAAMPPPEPAASQEPASVISQRRTA
ncbi:hypothetical protein V8C86DRAFT_2556802 [Haematococcus lacustris]